MKKIAKKALGLTGVIAAGAATVTAVFYNFTNRMVKVALDREQPKASEKSRNKLSGTGGQSKTFEDLSAASDKLKNSECEIVEITAHDGERLIGHWRKCENTERVIIAMHGWRSSWFKDFGAVADLFYENNCSVLFVEQRGQGESGGEYMGFGLIERYDCLDWIKWANENGCAELPLYLCGISMGASTVLMAAGMELPENVRGIIADCGFTSPHAIWKHVAENNLHMSYNGIIAAIVNDMCKKRIQIGANDYSCTDAMRECRVPVLFIHGTDDHFVPIEMTYENYKACTAPKRLLVVPGAEHGMSYWVDKEKYEKELKNFWHDFDGNI